MSCKRQLIGFNHNDAEEFLQFFLESLHDAIRITIPPDKVIIKGDVTNNKDKLMKDL